MPNGSKEYSDLYDYATSQWQGYLDAAAVELDMYLGAQNTDKDAAKAALTNRTLRVFNRLKRQVNLLSGYEIRNRHILKIAPVGLEDDPASSQHTKVIMQQMGLYDGYDVMSDAFRWGPLVTGSNLMEIYRDRDGLIRFGRHGYNQHLIDPAVTKIDMSDAGFYLTGRWLPADRIKELVPKESDRIDKVPGRGSMRWDRGNNLPFRDQANVRLYEEWWQRKTKYVPTVIVRETGLEIPVKDFADTVTRGDVRRANWVIVNIKGQDGSPAFSKYSKPTYEVRLHCLVDGIEVFEGPNPLGLDDFNVVWLAGEWCPECDRDDLKLQSFIRTGLDPQSARNKRLNQIMDMIESQLNTWRVVREGSLVDDNMAYGAGQGKVVVVSKEFQGTNDQAFTQLSSPDIPPGLFSVLEALEKEEMACSGLNDEIFGSDDKDIPGILHRYRTGQALTGQQGLFSNYRRAKRQLGRKLARINQLTLTEQAVQRITNEPVVPEFFEADFTQYDCTPVEGLLTDTQQELYYMELKDLRATFPDAQNAITLKMLIQAAPIQGKRELLAAIEANEQSARQMAEKQFQDQQVLNGLIAAETQSKIAKAQEDIADSQVARVKAVSELAKLDIESLAQLIEVGQSMGLINQVAPPARPQPQGQGA